jgi:phosphoribosylaminoimidazole-succinocarboxamide synthase
VTAVSDLPLVHRGKVRELYDLGDALLMVASDRISTYDAVHPTPIPGKGAVLTGISAFWFERLEDIVRHHVLSYTDRVPDEVRGRAVVVRKLEMLPIECIVRGHITGSGWKDYQATGKVSGIVLPGGLRESEKLPEPIFTPSTKATEGHDEAIDFEGAVRAVGDRAFVERVRDVSLALYSAARRLRGRARGDPRGHEVRVRDIDGELVPGRRGAHPGLLAVLAGRRLPDRPGASRASTSSTSATGRGSGWDKSRPRPRCPDDVVAGRERYERPTRAHGEPFRVARRDGARA